MGCLAASAIRDKTQQVAACRKAGSVSSSGHRAAREFDTRPHTDIRLGCLHALCLLPASLPPAPDISTAVNLQEPCPA